MVTATPSTPTRTPGQYDGLPDNQPDNQPASRPASRPANQQDSRYHDRHDGEVPDRELFDRLRDEPAGTAERDRACERLVVRYRWLVRWAAGRYGGRGEQSDELEQIGYVGLLEAIDRFDPDRGHAFPNFARPTILGEIRRHFRDRRRWVQVPRRLQELEVRLREAAGPLTQRHGREPTAADYAAYLELSEADVAEALATPNTFNPVSLDAPVDDAEDAATRLDLLPDDAAEPDHVVDTESLWPEIEKLPERKRQLILLRFYGNKNQDEIAGRLGISQMHVSRLLSQSLDQLRRELQPA